MRMEEKYSLEGQQRWMQWDWTVAQEGQAYLPLFINTGIGLVVVTQQWVETTLQRLKGTSFFSSISFIPWQSPDNKN